MRGYIFLWGHGGRGGSKSVLSVKSVVAIVGVGEGGSCEEKGWGGEIVSKESQIF